MRSVTLGLIAALSLSACGDDDAGPTDAGGTPDAGAMTVDAGSMADAGAMPDAAVATGTVTVRASGITGATGKVVLVFVTGPGMGGLRGAVCEPVTADPMAFVAVAKTPGATNPCELGAEVVYPDGTYDVTAGIYTPGMMTAERCATTTVVVAGTGDVTLPAFGTCP